MSIGPYDRQPNPERYRTPHSQFAGLSAPSWSPMYGYAEFWTLAGCTGGASPTTQAVTLNRLYAWPHYVRRDQSLDLLAINVTAQGASANVARIAVYENNPSGNNYPYRRMVEVQLSGIGNGVKSTPISLNLRGGRLYWFAYLSITGTTHTTRALATGAQAAIHANGIGMGTASQNYLFLDLTSPTQIPNYAPYGMAAPSSAGQNCPAIAFRSRT